MKLAISVGSHSHQELGGIVDFVRAAESLGVHGAWSAEAWSRDATTVLAYLAGQTERIRLGAGVMQVSARVPAMTAMTALSLDDLSGGRFMLGLGVSGPQVVEGLHGVSYAAPLTRLRETVDICRMIFRGEKVNYAGRCHVLPRPGGEGKAIRIDHEPVDIPIYLATLGPRSLEYTGAVADGWLGTSFSPDHPEAHFEYLRRGAESSGRSLADLDLQVACQVEIGSDVEAIIDRQRAGVAFQMGAMGSARTNFYNDAFKRAGFVDDALAIQRLWKAGDREGAARRVPDAMVTNFQAMGDPAMVQERFRRYRDAGIDCLNVRFSGSPRTRIAQLEQTADILASLD